MSQPRPVGTPGEVLCCDSLDEDQQSLKNNYKASYSSPVTVCWVLFILPNILCLPTVLASPRESVLAELQVSLSADIILPIGLGLWKQQKARRTPSTVYWYVSFCGVTTGGNQQHKVRRTNTCALLAKKGRAKQANARAPAVCGSSLHSFVICPFVCLL